MKKLFSLSVLLFSLLTLLVFSSSAADKITSVSVGKNVYGTAVLKWYAPNVSGDYYFNVYMNDEKISSVQSYNGSYFYCYIDNVYPGEDNMYKVEYYERNSLGGYSCVSSVEKKGTVQDYFDGYGYAFKGESNDCNSVKLEWDYRTNYIDEILDPETDDSLFDRYEYYFDVYYCENGSWKKAGSTEKQNYTVEGLEEGKEYQFRVKAYCKTKETKEALFLDESEVVSVATIVEYMDDLIVEKATETTALLKWGIDTTELLSTGIYTTDYSFDVYIEEGYNKNRKVGSTTETEFELTGLEENELYTVFVVLNCTRKNGIIEKLETSDCVDFKTTVTYFEEIAVSSIKGNSAVISWKFDDKGYADDEGEYYDDDDYKYYVYYINDAGKAIRIGSTKESSYTLENLTPNTAYTIRVVAYFEDWSGKVRIESIDADEFTTRVAAPERIVISYTPDKKLATIKWSAVEGASGYILYEYDFDEKEYVRLEKQKERTYTFGYTYGEKYRFYVKAYKTTEGKDSAGEGTKNTFIPCKKVTVSSDNQSVKPGKKLTLKATLSPSDSTDKIKWTTSNSEIATVSSKGVVKGVKNGKVTITATASSGKKATFKITVTNASISKTSKTVNVGQSYTIKINDYSGKVSWSTSNKKVATVSSKGVVKGVASGSAVITAKLGSGAIFTCKIKVTKASISPSKASVFIGSGKQLTLKNAAETVKWSSGNTKIVKVNSKGYITGVAKGTATVYATCGGVKYSCTVTVKNPPITIKDVNWYISYNGGVYPEIRIKNNTNKKIGRIEFDVWYLRSDGSYSYDEIYSDYYDELYTIDVLGAGETITYEWSEAVHWNSNLSAFYFGEVRIHYTDGTTYKYNYNHYWYDDNYYGSFY